MIPEHLIAISTEYISFINVPPYLNSLHNLCPSGTASAEMDTKLRQREARRSSSWSGINRPRRTKLGWCRGGGRQGEPEVRGTKGIQVSNTFFPQLLPNKGNLISMPPRINKSRKGAIPLQGTWKKNNTTAVWACVVTYKELKVILVHWEKIIFLAWRFLLCYALKLKSEKCSVNDPSSWKYKCYTGREHRTLDPEECWRERDYLQAMH